MLWWKHSHLFFTYFLRRMARFAAHSILLGFKWKPTYLNACLLLITKRNSSSFLYCSYVNKVFFLIVRHFFRFRDGRSTSSERKKALIKLALIYVTVDFFSLFWQNSKNRGSGPLLDFSAFFDAVYILNSFYLLWKGSFNLVSL